MGPNAEQMAAFSLDHYRAWRDANDVFDGMAALGDVSFNLTGGSEPRRIEGENVSPSLFRMLGQQHGVDRAENRRIEADAKCERDNDERGKAGTRDEASQRVPQIHPDRIHKGRNA